VGLPGLFITGQKLALPPLVVSAGVLGVSYFKSQVKPHCAYGVLVKIVSIPARRCHSGVGQFGPVGSHNSGQRHPHTFIQRFLKPLAFFLSVV